MVLTETACNRVTSAQTRGPLACGLEAGNHVRGDRTMKTLTAIAAAVFVAALSPASAGSNGLSDYGTRLKASRSNLYVGGEGGVFHSARFPNPNGFSYPHNSGGGISDRWGNNYPADHRRVRHGNGDCNSAMCGVSTTR